MDQARGRILAGVTLVGAGTVLLLGFVTAETLYPGYSSADQTISALGSADATRASRSVFNLAMVLAGVLTLGSAYGLHHVYRHRPLTALVGVTAMGGLVGVGVFPSQTGLPHFVAAMIAFTGVGLIALVTASIDRGPIRYLSLLFGVLELGSLALFLTVGGATPIGIGGLERWVAYLGIIWVIAFGGHLIGPSAVDG